MLVYNNIEQNLLKKSSLALGMFDGVHTGHKSVINSAKDMAHKYNCPCVVLSFSTHPQYITARTPTPQLTTLSERLELFEKEGVDIAIIIDFDKEFSQIPAEDYISKILVGSLNAKAISIGYDHRFGRGKRGNQYLLKDFAYTYNYEIKVVPPVTVEGQIVSSSIIRKMLKFGDITLSNKLLGRDFKLIGQVETGAKRGRELGFPTANIKPFSNVLIPACGVYAVEIQIENSTLKHTAVLNIGFRPTFADRNKPTLEAFIIDFNEDLYDKFLNIYFKCRIRDEKKFSSPEELIKQIHKDIATVKEISATGLCNHKNTLLNKV
ncbi:MAG: bifunctional riboflavin kinase/FAD synthetase [Cyanobacteriota bacterium]